MTNTAKETLEQCTDTHKVTKLYLRLKIALEEDNNADAITAVQNMRKKCEKKDQNFFKKLFFWRILFCCVLMLFNVKEIYIYIYILQAGKMDLTKDVLKQMVSPPEKNPALAELQLKCLQCVVALCLTKFEQNSTGFSNTYTEVGDCIEKAANILFVCENGKWHAEQCQWFATVCWNLALQPEANAEQQFRLLSHSFKLMLNVHGRQDTTKRITTYAIMATLSGVTASRRPAIDVQLKEAILRDVYQIAEKLKEVNPRWRENKQLALMLLTAEFEAIVCGPGAPNGKAVLAQVLSLSGDNTDIIEGFVAICQLIWMMTTVWNEGLQRYIEGALPSAKRYLNCALRIVDILPTLKAAYQQRLLSRYQGLFEDEMDQQSTTNDNSA
ncbi:hypothetical protein HPB51_026100 [Rhipicephalus microplus]|uniref:Uncharacterized protein n=1 Tax=Rhipicephalus microplus TaxID=6941 RepID=A0A9J6EED5_RHIMP|nr:hypothetical protein HPB51_026100 [Rhipicephalus microplus]